MPTNCQVAPTSQLVRLTNEQYGRTIRDLLNVTALTAFDNQPPTALLSAEGTTTPPTTEAYRAAAAAIADEVMADAELRAGFIACEPSGDQCLHDTTVAFGRRAYRRPLTETEVASFDQLLAASATDDPEGGEASARLLLETMLTSPSFLMRSEVGGSPNTDGEFTLNAYELATRLSYMLWGSTPDPQLDAAADAGELSTPEQIEAQARRMLDDGKARDMVVEFHRSYARMNSNGRWDNISKDEAQFPLFTPNAVPALVEEMEQFFDDVVLAGRGSFADLFLSTSAFVNADTAALYGLNPADFGAELTRVELAPDRPGFLTRAGFLAANAGYNQTSPILRGVFVLRDVIGIDTGPPPVGALQQGPQANSMREQVTAMTSEPECTACHVLINPPGFALEAFDATGAWQTVEASTGAQIDTVADVYTDIMTTVTVSGPSELMSVLAASPLAQRHYVQRWFEFAYQRHSPLDQCFIDMLASRFVAKNVSILDLVVDLTLVDAFRLRAVAGTEPDSDGVQR
jgi:hypothetical protein